jgi:type II secretory pathway component GspD/PulD (secretin)
MLRYFVVVLAVLLLAAAPRAALAQDGALISNVFSETDLRQAIEDVAAQAGVNIIADPSVQGVVSATLDNVTVEEALKLLLAGTEYQVEQTDDYYLVFRPDQTADMFPSVAQSQLIQVEHMPAETARNLLAVPLQKYVRADATSDTLAITAPPVLLARILKDLADIDQKSTLETVFVSLKHVKADSARALLPDYLQRFIKADTTRNVVAVTAPPGSRDQILSQLRRLDVAIAPGTQNMPEVFRTHVVKLNYATAAATLKLLPETLTPYVRADEVSNTLAVSAPEPMLSGILADIATIDSPRQHVMLSAQVVILEQADLLDFGGDWHWPTLTAGTVVSDIVGWPWELRIGYTPDREFTNALSLTLNLLTQNNEATVIANPQVLAQDGKEAEIRVTTEEYFQIAAQNDNVVTSGLEKIETGTILHITPQVGRNGELNLDMQIEVSDVVARGEQNLPVVSRRTAHSTVQLQNGGTAAVAGLVDSRAQFSRSGVPGLGSLPLLGHAFRTDGLNHQARQVAVFITATLVDGEGTPLGPPKHAVAPVAVSSDAQYQNELAAALAQLKGAH